VARVLVDTDVLVDHLRGQRRYDAGDDEVHVSSITRAELLAAGATDAARVSRLLGPMKEVDVDRAVAERAGGIRRLTGVRLADALIAATAIEGDLTLVTRNIWGFKGIAELDAMAPPSRE